MLIRQAIVTKFIAPTNFKGSRIKATAAAGSLTLEWNHAFNPEQNHNNVARALAQRFNWAGDYYAGAMPNDSGYTFVNVDRNYDRDSDPVFTIERKAIAA